MAHFSRVCAPRRAANARTAHWAAWGYRSNSRSRAQPRRWAKDGSTMRDALHVAAAALLGFLLLRRGCAGRAAEPTAEILHQLQPAFVRNLQPVQDGPDFPESLRFCLREPDPPSSRAVAGVPQTTSADVSGSRHAYWYGLGTCRLGRLHPAKFEIMKWGHPEIPICNRAAGRAEPALSRRLADRFVCYRDPAFAGSLGRAFARSFASS